MENTLENNKIIAVFMEFEEGFPHKTDRYGDQCEYGFHIPNIINWERHDADRTSHEFHFEQLSFHSSWDWLMPVVKKCATTYIDKHKFVKELSLFDMAIYSDIQEIYKEVVEYINWFNKQDRVPLS